MDLAPILRKVVSGEKLSDEERSFLAAYPSGTEPELNELREQLKNATAEREAARSELSALRFRNGVAKLAREFRFTDPDYLEYLCKRDNVDPDAVNRAEYMAKLKADTPRFFHLELASGPGNPQPLAAAPAAQLSIAGMIASAPAVNNPIN